MSILYLVQFGSLMYLPLFCGADGFCLQIPTLHFFRHSHNFDSTSEPGWEASEFNTIKKKYENHCFLKMRLILWKKIKLMFFPFWNPSQKKCCDSNLFLAFTIFYYLFLISFIIVGGKKTQNKEILHVPQN